jgi:hypothetical protein
MKIDFNIIPLDATIWARAINNKNMAAIQYSAFGVTAVPIIITSWILCGKAILK